ncbi:MAG: HI0074 family nucleotidyltransferase substrate-binding subunit [Candidatus Omnitrophota bacterium]|nr:nucleotidyltransferase substrate binding protein [Candidatus Omnitrophota bacterium]
MERLEIKYQDAVKALGTLKDILDVTFTEIVRDATIQRFEYTFEAIWKFLKEYLKQKEGVIVNSPKSCFREVLALGFLTEEETVQCLEMTDSRNDTSHTYKEAVAQSIYSKLKGYVSIMDRLVSKFENIL